MAESNRVRLAFREAGSSDNWKILRRTNDSLTAGTETTRSEEVRSDRKRGDQRVVTQTVGGTVDIEFSEASFDELLAGAMCTEYDEDTPEAGTDRLVVGVTTKKFDVLKSYLDSDVHVLMKDMEVGELQLTMDAASRVTGQITFAGTEADTEYDPSGDSFDEPLTTAIMDSSTSLGSISIDGEAPNGMCVTSLSITIDNSHQSDQCVGTQFQEHWKGSANITGGVTLRSSADAIDLWRKSLTNDPVSLGFELQGDEKTYKIDIGRTFLSGELPAGSLDDILTLELDHTVATDDEGEMLTIDRIDTSD